uniref:Ig-like domain-containing protein n=1 Tax=Gasterosteus aculeatus aculeatus TaxID=481459 RepID=G3PFQ1_GASAC
FSTGQVSAATFQQSPPQIVEESTEVHINCSHDDSNLVVMLWYQQRRDNGSLALIGYGWVGSPNYEGQFKEQFELTRADTMRGALVVRTAAPSHSAPLLIISVWHCEYTEAYFGAGTKLTVLEPGLNVTKPKVKVLRPSARECGNPKDKARKTIVCVASGFYPDHVGILWNIDGQNVTDRRVATDNAALRVDQYYRITSRLSVPAEEWFTKGKNFTCIVSFFNGKNTELYKSSTIGEKGNSETTYLMVTQTARFSYIIFIFKSSIYGAFVAFLVWRLQVCDLLVLSCPLTFHPNCMFLLSLYFT